MGIVAVLAALLLPFMQQMRERSMNIRCISNLRQIGVIVQAYVADRGMYPDSGFETEGAWYLQLEPYGLEIDKKVAGWRYNRLMYCPLSGKDGTGGWPAINSDYGLNRLVAGAGGSNPNGRMRPVNVTDPAQTVLMTETGNKTALSGDFRFRPETLGFLTDGPRASAAEYGGNAMWMAFRHPRPEGDSEDMRACHANTLFCDGHVESISWRDPKVQNRELRNETFRP